jgi:hypothetical protein
MSRVLRTHGARRENGVIAPSAVDMIHRIADRFAGGPDPDPDQLIGVPGVTTTTCPR